MTRKPSRTSSPTSQPQATEDLAIKVARENFSAYKRFVWHRYRHAKHLAVLDSLLAEILKYSKTDGKEGIARLDVALPPRHGKSMTVARLFPSFFLGNCPDKRVIVAAYGESLAVGHSRVIRNIIKTPKFGLVFPGVTMSDDSSAKDSWNLKDYDGGLDAVGKGGGITGKGADLLVTDDLIKGREEAEREEQRDKDWNWLKDDIFPRFEPNAAHVHIGTRWHMDDVGGRIERQEADLWTILKLPAIYEVDLPNLYPGDWRQPGEALWPDRYPIDVLALIRRRMGEYSFMAEYQQNPTNREGNLIKRAKLHFIDDEPSDIYMRVRYYDLALSDNTRSDFTVGLLMGITPDRRIIILDRIKYQEDFEKIADRLTKDIVKDGKLVRQGLESSFFQSKIIQKVIVRPELHSFSVWGIPSEKDKFLRAQPFAARVEAGEVYVLRRAWTEDFVDQICAFPDGIKDDDMDATSGAYDMLGDATAQGEAVDNVFYNDEGSYDDGDEFEF